MRLCSSFRVLVLKVRRVEIQRCSNLPTSLPLEDHRILTLLVMRSLSHPPHPSSSVSESSRIKLENLKQLLNLNDTLKGEEEVSRVGAGLTESHHDTCVTKLFAGSAKAVGQ
eukprot:3932595-Rhodomonas_salina.2